MKGISKTVALLCGVNSCRIRINKGFNENASHNAELHIIGVGDDINLPDTILIYWLKCVLPKERYFLGTCKVEGMRNH